MVHGGPAKVRMEELQISLRTRAFKAQAKAIRKWTEFLLLSRAPASCGVFRAWKEPVKVSLRLAALDLD
jgi:hypothetical protein